MKYKNGEDVKHGDLIQWHCYDSDDNKTWRMIGIYKAYDDSVVYLNGGSDFGEAIGTREPASSVIAESENNDDYAQGITKIGTYKDACNKLDELNKDIL